MIFKPTDKRRIIDCVADTGIDVSPWHQTEGDPSTNPKFCYEWTYSDPKRFIFVFNVWAEEIEEVDGVTRTCKNSRKTAEAVTPAQSKRYHRARRSDRNLELAYSLDAAVRMIVIDGDRNADKQRVHLRDLDPVAWFVQSYDPMTGSGVVVRGPRPIQLAA